MVVNKNDKKCILMFSGGLDSRLALRIMQDQGFEITALFFNLPFGTGCCNSGCAFNFSQMQGVKLEIIDCQKGENLQNYLKIIKEGKHGRGAGINPCVDCRLFMFKKAKEIADKKNIELVVTGEVLGERPMSQMKKPMDIIEEESELKGRLLRPLSAKLLPETDAEKERIVNREKLYGIQGRKREKQMSLAERFKISYPSPAGGCLLCEKELKKRFKRLFDRGLNDNEIKLVEIGRHFIIDGSWIVLGRNKEENKIIEEIKTGEVIIPEFIGPSALILDKADKNTKEKVNELINAYSKKGSLEQRKNFEEYKV